MSPGTVEAEKPVILIIIDALGYRLASRYNFFPGSLPVRRRLRTVAGFSQSALTSILTGSFPDEHGQWMMYSFAPERSPLKWLNFFPPSVSSKRRWLRRLIDWKLKRIDGMKSYYSLYSVPKEILALIDFPADRNIFMPAREGRCRTIIDEYHRRGADIFIRDYHIPEKESFIHLGQALQDRSHSLYVLYTAGLDASLHRRGTNHPEIGDHLEWYGDRLDDIASAAPEADIMVMGDHGMCEVEKSVDIISRVENLELKIPEDYIPFYDATMARFRICSGRGENELKRLLDRIEDGHILNGEEKERLHISFEDNRFGDIIFLLDEGCIINPSYMGDEVIPGMHGFHPDAECMYSAMFSNMERSDKAERITDIAGVIMPGFGIERGCRNGDG